MEIQSTHAMANHSTSTQPSPPFTFSCALDSDLVIEGKNTLSFQFRTRPHLEIERFQIVRSHLITKNYFSRISGPSPISLRNRFWYLIDSFHRTGKFLCTDPTTELDQKKVSKAIHYAEMVLRILSQIASQTNMPESPNSGEEQPKNPPTQQSPPITTTRAIRGKARKAATRGRTYSARPSAPSSLGRKSPLAFQPTRRTFYQKQAANRSEPSSPEVIHVPDDSLAKTDQHCKSPAHTRSSGPASSIAGTATKVFPAVADVMSVMNEAPVYSPIRSTVDKRPSESNVLHDRQPATHTNSAAHVQPTSESLQSAVHRDYSSPTVAHRATSNTNEQRPQDKSDSGHRQEEPLSKAGARSPSTTPSTTRSDPYATQNASAKNEQFRSYSGNERSNSGSNDRIGDPYDGMEEEILDERHEDDPRTSGEQQDAMQVVTALETLQSPFNPFGASPGRVGLVEQSPFPAQSASPSTHSPTLVPSQVQSSMQGSLSKATVVQSKPAVQPVSAPPPDLGKQLHPVATKLSKSNMQQLPKGQAQGDKPVETMYGVRSMPGVKSKNSSALEEAMRMTHVKLFEEKQNMEVQRKRMEFEARRLQFEEGKRKDKDAQVLRDQVRRRTVDKQRAAVEKRRLEIDEDRLKLDTERLEKEVPWRERSYEQNLQQSAKRTKLDMVQYELEEKKVKAQIDGTKESVELQKQERKDGLVQANRSYGLRVEELRLRTASEKEIIELENRKLVIEEQELEMRRKLQTAVLAALAAFGRVMSGTN